MESAKNVESVNAAEILDNVSSVRHVNRIEVDVGSSRVQVGANSKLDLDQYGIDLCSAGLRFSVWAVAQNRRKPQKTIGTHPDQESD